MPRIIVLSTCGSTQEARLIARDLLERKLAACVNILQVSSCYRWKRKIVKEREWLMVIKTNSKIFPKVKQRILALHSYEVPEVVSLKIDRGSQPYLAWLDRELLS
ncbi:MAG: divalent-cation tolerance protein CutA [Candidatus Bathyarchaeia archaeon]